MSVPIYVSGDLVTALMKWSARRSLAVPDVVERAITEYFLDVEAGLLGLPALPKVARIHRHCVRLAK